MLNYHDRMVILFKDGHGLKYSESQANLQGKERIEYPGPEVEGRYSSKSMLREGDFGDQRAGVCMAGRRKNYIH
jgi:hypothetical protein